MRAFAFILMLLPVIVRAETASIRTGWHPTFTRIVVAIPQGSDWQLGRVQEGFALRVDGVDDFDTAGFFSRLPNDRIQGADGSNGFLSLDLSCNCHATAFLWKPDRLVVDVRDGNAAPDNPFESALKMSAQGSRERNSPPQVVLDLLPRPETRVTLQDLSPLTNVAEAKPDLRDIEAQIIQSLTRAADQGLLELSDNLPASPPAAIEEASEPEPEESVADVPRQESEAEPTVRSGVRAFSSADLGIDLAAILTEYNAQSIDCWPDNYVQVDSWAGGDDFSEDISLHRSRIYGEFDRIDHDAVTDLARTFIYYGFGREALQALEIDTEKTAEREAIVVLAYIIDDDAAGRQQLSTQIECEGLIAVWALLSNPVADLKGHPDPDRLVRQFKTLPEHLRTHLTPRFAERLVALGEVDSAENLLSGGPVDAEPSVENIVVSAEISTTRGELEDAQDALQDLAENNSRLTPEALIKLIDLQMAQKQPVDPAMMALLETKRFEYRSRPIDGDLADVEVRARIYENQFMKALDTLRLGSANSDTFPKDSLSDLLAERVTETADDMTFLTYAFEGEATEISPRQGNLVAQRLLTLGFPDRASEVLASAASGEDMRERRYLRAMAAVAIDDFDKAKTILSGITSERANTILSEGQEAGTDPKEPSVTAWRAGDWSRLASDEDPLLRDASTLALNQTSPSPDADAPLRNGRALIEQSDLTRNTLDGLLDRFERPAIDLN